MKLYITSTSTERLPFGISTSVMPTRFQNTSIASVVRTTGLRTHVNTRWTVLYNALKRYKP